MIFPPLASRAGARESQSPRQRPPGQRADLRYLAAALVQDIAELVPRLALGLGVGPALARLGAAGGGKRDGHRAADAERVACPALPHPLDLLPDRFLLLLLDEGDRRLACGREPRPPLGRVCPTRRRHHECASHDKPQISHDFPPSPKRLARGSGSEPLSTRKVPEGFA